jgi:hypothetical protein
MDTAKERVMTESNMKVYFGWNNFPDMVRSFLGYNPQDTGYRCSVRPEQVLFAAYSYEDYSGTASVLIEQGGNLFEVYGSHCSCNGLEGQWEPKPVTWASLALRLPNLDLYGRDGGGSMRAHTLEAREAFYRLVRRMTGQPETLPRDPADCPWKKWSLTEDEWNDWGHLAFGGETLEG